MADTGLFLPASVIEARARQIAVQEVADAPSAPASTPARRGYDSDIPIGGSTIYQQSVTAAVDRRELIDQLINAYLACPWSSACINVIARTIIGGGVDVGLDVPDQERLRQQPDQAPAPVEDLKRFLGYVNPRVDIRQFMYQVIVDLEVTGDAFIELTWALDKPIAMWNLDSSTMIPIADEHGLITSYKQVIEDQHQTVEFEPHEIIHIQMHNPKGGIYGVSPTQQLLLPLTNWLFTESLLKETMRKGNPSRVHIDWPHGTDLNELNIFREQYLVRNIGIANIANPLLSRGGANAQEFKPSAIAEYLATLDAERDVITSGYGVPNRKVGISEAGSLGGAGVETGQDRTLTLNTCRPLAEIILEAFNFALLAPFGVDGWKIEFDRVDNRDDFENEQIRDFRIRNGTWAVNRARADANEPPVDGGDIPVIIDRQGVIAVPDLPEYTKANLDLAKAQASNAASGSPATTPPPGTAGLLPAAGAEEDDPPTGAQRLAKARASRQAAEMAAIDAAYQQRRRQAVLEIHNHDT